MKHKHLLFICLALFLVACVSPAFANQPSVNLMMGNKEMNTQELVTRLFNFHSIAVFVGVIIAASAVMFGAFKYYTDGEQGLRQSKTTVISALILAGIIAFSPMAVRWAMNSAGLQFNKTTGVNVSG